MMDDEPTRLVNPVVASRYELLCTIASGGMATVYVARQLGAGGFQRIVAIKRMHPHIAANPDIQAMFHEEARIASLIHDPHVVGVHDVYEAGGERLLVMDFVDGISLGQLRKALRVQGTPMPVRPLLRIVVDTLRGLHAAHEQTGMDGAPLNVVHRDATPQNILIGADGAVKVTDFGIARAEQRSVMTEAGQAKGKFAYMAPEQCAGGAMDRRVDVFAMGVVLWELLTGRPLFHGDNEAVIITRITAGKYPKPSEVKPEIPAALEAIVMTALSLDPHDRFPTTAAFADAIELFAHDAVGLADQAEVSSLVMTVAGGMIQTRRQHVQDAIAGRRPKIPWGAPMPLTPGSGSSSQQLYHAVTLDSHVGPVGTSAPATGFGRPTTKRALAVWIGASAVLSAAVIATAFTVFRSERAEELGAPPEPARSAQANVPGVSPTSSAQAVHVRIDADDEIVEIRVPDGNDVEIAGNTATFTAARGSRPIPLFVRLRDGSTVEESVVPNANALIKVRSSMKTAEPKTASPPRTGGPAPTPTRTGGGLKYETNPYE